MDFAKKKPRSYCTVGLCENLSFPKNVVVFFVARANQNHFVALEFDGGDAALGLCYREGFGLSVLG
jgi:hypothetical protein